MDTGPEITDRERARAALEAAEQVRSTLARNGLPRPRRR